MTMKRLTIFMALVLGASTLFAQTSKEINYGAYAKKLAKSDAAIENPKKNAKMKTWVSRASLLMDIYDAQLLKAYPGMDSKTFMLVIGKPNEQYRMQKDGKTIDKYVMERVTFYFANGVMESWEITQPIVENPLDLAFESLKKAIELDKKGGKSAKIKDMLNKLKGLYVNEGSNSYTRQNYEKAFACFKNVIAIGKLPILNHKDTAIYYYTGLSAQLAKKYAEAIPYYEEALKLGFTSEGSIYFNIFDAYKSMGKAEEGEKYLEEGLMKYPKNTNILFSLISYYIEKGEDPSKILVYIDKAIKSEPNNASLHFAKGTLHDKLGNFDEAVQAYTRATELNPKFFDAYYNIGALYFNAAVKLNEEANKVPPSEMKRYDELLKKANDKFKESIPYMQKAYEVNPKSKEVVEALKSIYFRFRNENDEMAKNYEKFNNLYKQM